MKKNRLLLGLAVICLLVLNPANAQQTPMVSAQSYLPKVAQSGSTAFWAKSDGSTGFSAHIRALRGSIIAGYGYTYGVHGTAYTKSPSTNGRAYGAFGMAGNANINYGVYGELRGSNRGTAIFGRNQNLNNSVLFSGQWAGYFIGDVKVTHDVFASAFNTSSDKRLKKNIKNIVNPIEKIKTINGVNYEYKTEKHPDRYFREGVQTGFIAQEVEKVVPDAVSDDQEGYKTVDYTRIIPLLVEGMKEQQQLIELQQMHIEQLEEAVKKLEQQHSSSNEKTKAPNIFQTSNLELKAYPNPFDLNQKIEFLLPEPTVVSLQIVDASGRTVLHIINQKKYNSGHYSQEVNTAKLVSGIYFVQLRTTEEMKTLQMVKK